jgi:hypothetical protein
VIRTSLDEWLPWIFLTLFSVVAVSFFRALRYEIRQVARGRFSFRPVQFHRGLRINRSTFEIASRELVGIGFEPVGDYIIPETGVQNAHRWFINEEHSAYAHIFQFPSSSAPVLRFMTLYDGEGGVLTASSAETLPPSGLPKGTNLLILPKATVTNMWQEHMQRVEEGLRHGLKVIRPSKEKILTHLVKLTMPGPKGSEGPEQQE